jgi:hypothetical protein
VAWWFLNFESLHPAFDNALQVGAYVTMMPNPLVTALEWIGTV